MGIARILGRREILRLAVALHTSPQSRQGFLAVAGIFRRQAGERVGDDVAVVQVVHLRVALEIQPQAMDKLHIIRLQRWGVGTNVEGLGLPVGRDHEKCQLLLRPRERFPGLTDVISLFPGL